MTVFPSVSRRQLLAMAGFGAASALTGCSTVPPATGTQPQPLAPAIVTPIVIPPESQPDPALIYAAEADGGFPLPAIPYKKIDPQFYRQRVIDPTGEPAGTVVVDTRARFLYLVESGGTAMRYGVSIGKDGFAWEGEGVIQWRKKWPRWTPPDEMVARDPSIRSVSAANGGMIPGLNNPLGARALYIFKNGKDTLYRVHGTPDWQSVGKATSSGCVRMLNQDVIDLFERVSPQAPIVVL